MVSNIRSVRVDLMKNERSISSINERAVSKDKAINVSCF